MPLKNFVLAALVLTTFFGKGQVRVIDKINGFKHPESIDASSGRFLITDVGDTLLPTAKDSDGIVWMDDNKLPRLRQPSLLLNKIMLHAPKGITSYHKGSSYIAVTDIDALIICNIVKGRDELSKIDLSAHTGFANDVAALNDSIVFVSATDKNCILKVNIKTAAVEKLDLPAIKGPNGLCIDSLQQYMYCVGWGEGGLANGELWRINLKNLKAERWGSDLGHLDGCALFGNRLYFTDWVERRKVKGKIRYMNLTTREITTLDELDPIGGPADIYINAAYKLLYVPASLDGAVYVIKLQ